MAESFGAWVSIVVLCRLAALNIDSVFSTPSHHVARLVGEAAASRDC